MDTIEVIGVVLGSSVLAAIVGQLGSIIINRLTRKDAKEDKKDEIKEQLKELTEAVSAVDKKLDGHIADHKTEKADYARTRILRFGDEVSQGVKHSREHWEQVLGDIDFYVDFCTDNETYPNSKAEKTIEFIEETYKKRLVKNDFLREDDGNG